MTSDGSSKWTVRRMKNLMATLLTVVPLLLLLGSLILISNPNCSLWFMIMKLPPTPFFILNLIEIEICSLSSCRCSCVVLTFLWSNGPSTYSGPLQNLFDLLSSLYIYIPPQDLFMAQRFLVTIAKRCLRESVTLECVISISQLMTLRMSGRSVCCWEEFLVLVFWAGCTPFWLAMTLSDGHSAMMTIATHEPKHSWDLLLLVWMMIT